MLGTIQEINVKDLFGRYDYHIRLGDQKEQEPSPISLLYGENGTGKTTILNLLFHLLSSDLHRGHKTYIAKIPFRDFKVIFSDQTTISASRTNGDLTGDFWLGLSLSSGISETVPVTVDPESGGVSARFLSPELEALLDKIASLVPDVFYLGDDRFLIGDTLPTREMGADNSRLVRYIHDDEVIEVDTGSTARREVALRESIMRTRQQLYIEFARASTRGEADARQIYASILRSIASAGESQGNIMAEQVLLDKELKELEEISGKFAEFDLGSAIDAAPFAESLSSADEQTLPVVVQVLKSFLNGQRARLNALDALYKKMHEFVAIINDYLTDKDIDLDVSKGLTIRVPNGELNPALLSSGEQHLLLLFLHVFASSDQSRLFIIDEPELSLNVKWQRNLVDSLLALTQDTQCQFLLATHSIELLSKHRHLVTQLKR